MVSTILIILNEYLGEYEGNPNEDYDVKDEEAFAFIHSENELGCFKRPTEKKKSHLRPLHVTAYMSDICVNKVLVNRGATISLSLEQMLIKVGKHFDDLNPSNISMNDYSSMSTPVKGLVTLQVQVGSLYRNIILWWCLQRLVIMPCFDEIGTMALELYLRPCIRAFFFGLMTTRNQYFRTNFEMKLR
ncbi:hypothetical protein Ahy_B03g064304 [Arachis hypogaea]|uniref:Uncharacterized protein n=1 Tax=Arachis hypogaea TaxID=3818 RepID=A0A444ZZB4_ARAHY|nr:hypothetical protein Ahy_B03g064304 [Arachis hypogaea]